MWKDERNGPEGHLAKEGGLVDRVELLGQIVQLAKGAQRRFIKMFGLKVLVQFGPLPSG
jgi:hypothetical protein